MRLTLGSASAGQPSLLASAAACEKRRRLHDFEVLLVLRGGAGGDFVEPFAVRRS